MKELLRLCPEQLHKPFKLEVAPQTSSQGQGRTTTNTAPKLLPLSFSIHNLSDETTTAIDILKSTKTTSLKSQTQKFLTTPLKEFIHFKGPSGTTHTMYEGTLFDLAFANVIPEIVLKILDLYQHIMENQAKAFINQATGPTIKGEKMNIEQKCIHCGKPDVLKSLFAAGFQLNKGIVDKKLTFRSFTNQNASSPIGLIVAALVQEHDGPFTHINISMLNALIPQIQKEITTLCPRGAADSEATPTPDQRQLFHTLLQEQVSGKTLDDHLRLTIAGTHTLVEGLRGSGWMSSH